MFLTETDLINAKLAAEGALNESDILKYILNDDINNPRKRLMEKGEKYYVCEHDIMEIDFSTENIIESQHADDAEEEKEVRTVFKNPNRSNHHNINPFHRILVDQKVSYIAGREPTISVKGAEEDKNLKAYETLLTERADEEFNEVLQDLITGASNKGYEVLHVYYDKNGVLQYNTIPANETILIYDTLYQRKLEQVIRYYDIVIVRGGKKYNRKKVEWWTKDKVTYYMEDDNHNYLLDMTYPHNPAPHWWSITTVDGMQRKQTPHSWGRVPFVVLKNNREGSSDLEKVKGLIDAYDLLSSEGTNNMLDLVELYWVISGYGGETASAIARKLKVNKAVNVIDNGGKVEAKQIDLPMAGRLDWMEMLRKDIYHFGQGIDTDADKFGNAPSGVSLKFQYTLLDLKANAMTAKLKKAIRDFFWFVTDDYNREHNASYDSSLIEISINKTMITNDMETVQMIRDSEGIVSKKTLLAKHPFVDDVNAELTELKEQEEEMDIYNKSFPKRKVDVDVQE